MIDDEQPVESEATPGASASAGTAITEATPLPYASSPHPLIPSSPEAALRVGILGAGKRGTALAHAAARLPGVAIVAVADAEPDRAEALAKRWDAKQYMLWQTMLIFEKLDALFITTPSAGHAEQALTALDQRMHVYVEKPPALDMAMAQRIADKAQEQDRIVHVGFQHRYGSLVAPWYQALEGRAISLVHAHLYRGLPESDEGRAGAGAQIVEEAIHLLDLCRYLVDEITAVTGFRGQAFALGDSGWVGPDSVAVALEFASGAAGSLSLTYGMPLPIAGHLALDVVAEGPLLLRYTGAELQVAQESGVENWRLTEPPDFAAVTAFLDAVRTGDRTALRIPYDDAMQSLRVALACTEAAEKGGVVRL